MRVDGGAPGHVWNPPPHAVLFAVDGLDFFADSGLGFPDVGDHLGPQFLFPLPVLRRNQLIADVVDGEVRSGHDPAPHGSLMLVGQK